MKNEGLIYITIIVLAFLVLGGFYFVFDKLSALSAEVKNVELNYQLASKGNPISPALATTSTTDKEQNNPVSQIPETIGTSDIVVKTGIIFTVNSSPTLQPQTLVTVNVESVTKKTDGTVIVALKAFTNQASSYSAIDPASFLEYVSLDSENQNPSNVSAVFNSMPPKSAVTGTLTFYVDPTKNSMIIQTGQGDNPNFYEINFGTGTYKETTIG